MSKGCVLMRFLNLLCANIAPFLNTFCVGVVFAENALALRQAFLIHRQRAVVVAHAFE